MAGGRRASDGRDASSSGAEPVPRKAGSDGMDHSFLSISKQSHNLPKDETPLVYDTCCLELGASR